VSKILEWLKLIALYCAPGVVSEDNHIYSKEDKDLPSREELEEEIRLLKEEILRLRDR
jgi:uncharacterized small protein (DUF1192 family)